MTFTVEGFDFDNDQSIAESETNEGDGEVPGTPDGQDPFYDMDWAGTDSQPTNHQLGPQSDHNVSPSNTSLASNSPPTPNSPTSPVSPVSTPNSSSTNSSSTGGGAPKRYRLLTDLYEATEQMLMACEDEEPSTYLQAKKRIEWVNAMKAELSSIEKNNTWSLMNLPNGRKPIGLK